MSSTNTASSSPSSKQPQPQQQDEQHATTLQCFIESASVVVNTLTNNHSNDVDNNVSKKTAIDLATQLLSLLNTSKLEEVLFSLIYESNEQCLTDVSHTDHPHTIQDNPVVVHNSTKSPLRGI